jgi:hypothetical protein
MPTAALPDPLFRLPVDALADRADRMRLMIVCGLCNAALPGSIPLAWRSPLRDPAASRPDAAGEPSRRGDDPPTATEANA